jgi:hypothetical protein
MPLHPTRSSALAASAAALLAFAAPAGLGVPSAIAAGLFSGFAGSWSGDGMLTLAGGSSEPIRCRATYEVENDGNKLKQELRCASDSYSLTVESNVTYNPDAGVISGTWFETGYATGGFLNGSASAGHIEARVDGNGFSAQVAIVTNSDEQMVTIRPQNMDVTEVSVTMRRADL